MNIPGIGILLGKKIRDRILASSERVIYTHAAQVLIDGSVVGFAFVFAYIFRFDGIPPIPRIRQMLFFLPYAILLYLAMNHLFKLYSQVWRLIGLRDAFYVSLSCGSAALILLAARILYLDYHFVSYLIPYGILVLHPVLTQIGMIGVRSLRRLLYQRSLPSLSGSQQMVGCLLLVGAGNAGLMLAKELESSREYKIIGFVDDDKRKLMRRANGLPILGSTADIESLVVKHNVDKVVLCMPEAPKAIIRQIALRCQQLPVKVFTIPTVPEILTGKVGIAKLRPIQMTELLGRASIDYKADDPNLIDSFRGRRIMVTGAAGSIGSELTRQLKYFAPTDLILLDKDESGVFETALEIREHFSGHIHEVIADIQNYGRLEHVFSRYEPEIIFHAAAYKHVPMMEAHPWEAIANNVFGTRNVVQLAQTNKARSFVMISTDKAVNPTNVMGASKRLAEMIVQRAARNYNGRFCCVRFGNVLGSRASVVPIFLKRIAEGKSLKITHPEIRRYFMTIPEAVQLVIQAGSMGKDGEVFVLDMGNPVKIADMARELILLSGLTPYKDIEIEFTGLRPGEKLYEELLIGPSARNTAHPKIFVEQALSGSWLQLDRYLTILQMAVEQEESDTIIEVLKEMDINYLPTISADSEILPQKGWHYSALNQNTIGQAS
jgi:FlaA1/EpsC-like NDP-sugar epimerase